MRHFEINQTYSKVLCAISELNERGYYPLNEGIYKILAGILDEETAPFNDLLSFSTLTSYSSKKICRLTLMLFRQGYINKIFDSKSKKLYFAVTEKGSLALANYFKIHKKSFTKKAQKSHASIVKID